MASTEDLMRKFQKRDLTPARPAVPAAADSSEKPEAARPRAVFRQLKRRGGADDDAATVEGLFDEKDGLIGLGG